MPDVIGKGLDLIGLQTVEGGDDVLFFQLESEVELDSGADETDQGDNAENIQNNPGEQGVVSSVSSYHKYNRCCLGFAKKCSLWAMFTP
jgi:hypothetical protein